MLLVELPNGDFAVTMAKLLFLSACQVHRYRALAEGPDERLAGIAVGAAVICWTLGMTIAVVTENPLF